MIGDCALGFDELFGLLLEPLVTCMVQFPI